MTTEDQTIKIIQELAEENFNNYREQYVHSLDEAISSIKEVAESYYDNRNEDEIKRDETHEITNDSQRRPNKLQL